MSSTTPSDEPRCPPVFATLRITSRRSCARDTHRPSVSRGPPAESRRVRPLRRRSARARARARASAPPPPKPIHPARAARAARSRARARARRVAELLELGVGEPLEVVGRVDRVEQRRARRPRVADRRHVGHRAGAAHHRDAAPALPFGRAIAAAADVGVRGRAAAGGARARRRARARPRARAARRRRRRAARRRPRPPRR